MLFHLYTPTYSIPHPLPHSLTSIGDGASRIPGDGAESAVGGVNTAIALADAEDVAEAPCSAAAASAPRMGWLGWLQGQGAAAATGAGVERP